MVLDTVFTPPAFGLHGVYDSQLSGMIRKGEIDPTVYADSLIKIMTPEMASAPKMRTMLFTVDVTN
ncbi:hypothetical protein Mapa_001718 [Marchantia paleacea]|nr:hypothetical protein Mapa_001718 [Marchantia paleacea]